MNSTHAPHNYMFTNGGGGADDEEEGHYESLNNLAVVTPPKSPEYRPSRGGGEWQSSKSAYSTDETELFSHPETELFSRPESQRSDLVNESDRREGGDGRSVFPVANKRTLSPWMLLIAGSLFLSAASATVIVAIGLYFGWEFF